MAYPKTPTVGTKLYHLPLKYRLDGQLLPTKYLVAQPPPAGVGRIAIPAMIGGRPRLIAFIQP